MHTFIMKKDIVPEKEKGPMPLFRFFNMPKRTEKVKNVMTYLTRNGKRGILYP
jgi:hypothetical protein